MIKYTREYIFKKSGIYCIKNTINDRIYIGSTVNFYKRFNAHKNGLKNKTHPNKALSNFVKIHGIEFLYFEIIEFCEKAKLIELENFYIKKHNAYGHGFNCSQFAENSFKGLNISDTTRLKLSIARKKYIENNKEENKNRLDSARKELINKFKLGLLKPHNLGKKASLETRELQSKIKKGKKSLISENKWIKIRDAAKKSNSGSKSHYAKLSETNVIEIKTMLSQGINKKEIADKHNISLPTIYDINSKRSWAHITVHNGWIEDDSADHIIPVFEMYEYDKQTPGVKIKLITSK